MACGNFTCTRTLLAVLNVFYMAIACILIGVACYGKAVAVIATISVMGGIIACGVLLLLIAILGLVGAVKHHQVLLFFYMIILFLLFIVQFAVACACLALTDEQQRQLYVTGWNNARVTLKKKTQDLLGCCGRDKDTQDLVGDSDYGSVHPPCSWSPQCQPGDNSSLPICCGVDISTEPPYSNTSTVSPSGCPLKNCWAIVEPKLHEAVKIVGGLGLFFSFTELMAVWLTVRFRNQKDPRINPTTFL